LQGSVGIFGARAVLVAAQALEYAGRQNELADTPRMLNELERELQGFNTELADLALAPA
jgi:hypothetical protein